MLVAGYHTDFPNVHVGRVGTELFGKTVAGGLRRLTEAYAGVTYREFDRVYTLSSEMRGILRGYGVPHVDLLDLGVDTDLFSPTRRDPTFRERMGLPGTGPLLGYAGRIDNERKADQLIAMMRHQPRELGAALVMFGDGKLRDHQLLYASDGAGGEFLQAYTETFQDRFFFEVVQRLGGYDRYGEGNAPVRMAAQARRRKVES